MRTRATELFGIRHPIILSPMALVARAELVSAVSRAGGLGLFAAPGLTPVQWRQQICEIKEKNAGRPFGVNIMPNMPKVKDLINILLEEAVPIWVSSFRNPFKFFNIRKPDNVLYVPAVGNAHQALSVEKNGADAVIVQSWESGGHPGRIASSVLIPEVAEAVKIPVIAAGGFADGRGLAAALALGAQGIAMGTRFAITKESPLPQSLKEMYLKAGDADAILNSAWDGIPARAITKMGSYYGWWTHPWDAIPNLIINKKDFNASWKEIFENARFVREIGGSPVQFATGLSMFRKAAMTGKLKGKSYAPCGQVVGLINDIPSCTEIIERTTSGAEEIIKHLHKDNLSTI
ncbi:MAG: nitronate monooxygenase [Dehalococcoidales bacterium]|nr:nitronate monooxygenase [Dehalococcoidales bacterium]